MNRIRSPERAWRNQEAAHPIRQRYRPRATGLGLAVAGVLTALAAVSCNDSSVTPELLPDALAGTSLHFSQPPTRSLQGDPFEPTVEVSVVDSTGAVVRTASGTVTLTLGRTMEGAALVGATQSTLKEGVASFPLLAVDKASTDLILKATIPGVSSVESAPFIIGPKPVVIDSIRAQLLARTDTSVSLSFSGALPQIDSGDVVVGTQQGGFLRQVIRSRVQGQQVDLTTSQAVLSEVVRDGHLLSSGRISLADFGQAPAATGSAEYGPVTVEAMAPGVSIEAGTLVLKDLSLISDAATGASLKIKRGSLTFEGDHRFAVDWSNFGLQLQRAEVWVKAGLELDADVEAFAGRAVTKNQELVLARYSAPFVTVVGGLPVEGRLRISLIAVSGVDLRVGGTLSGGMRGSAAVQAGGLYEDGAFTPILNLPLSFSGKALTSSLALGDLVATVGLKIETAFELYQVPLPSGYGTFLGRYATKADLGAEWLTTACSVGPSAGVRYNLDLLFKRIDFTAEKSWDPTVLPGCSSSRPLFAVAKVSVTPASVTLGKGETAQLVPAVADSSGRALSRAVTWTSSNPGIASVTSAGLVRAVASGTATIVANVEGKEGSARVEVVNTPPRPNISSPAAGASFVRGTAVAFSGGATDTEDGAIPPSGLAWSSSLDGALGTGGSFSRADLAVGAHTISLRATDRDRATATTAVNITVTAPPTPTYLLTVTGAGTGAGTVTSSPGGVNCTSTAGATSGACSSTFTSGTVVTLTPNATSGTFSGWGGACTGTGGCTVTLSQERSVTATFTAPPTPTYLLAVTGAGTGTGTVTSSPAGINCTSTAGATSGACSGTYPSGTVVTLTPNATSGAFSGWGGACSGTGGCTVTLSEGRSVTASFTAPAVSTYSLTVTIAGTGAGTVTSSPVGINCTSTAGATSGACSSTYTSGTVVTLTPNATSGTFSGWGGACSGTGDCTVTLSQERSVTATFTAPSADPLLSLTTTAFPPTLVGADYREGVIVSGGRPPFTWDVSGDLPPGLALNPTANSSLRVVEGRATKDGTFNSKVTVRDSGSPQQQAQVSLSIRVVQPTIAITTPSLPGGFVGAAYTHALMATGGQAPYDWSISGGPSWLGIGIQTGVLFGTPPQAGTYTFTANVWDAGSPRQSISRQYTLTVTASTLSITTESLPPATVGVPYSQTVTVTGGKAPYNFRYSGDDLPAGLALNASSGAIAGTPTASGSVNINVEVLDASNPQQSARRSFSLTVNAPPLSIPTTSIPAGTVGVPYSQTLTAVGGTKPYTWRYSGDNLPEGVGLVVATGEIQGTPAKAGTFNFTAEVLDASSPRKSAARSFSLTVNPAAQGALSFTRLVPEAMQTIRPGQEVQYSITVKDNLGLPVSGAQVSVGNPMTNTTDLAVLTDGNGVTTYTARVPAVIAATVYALGFKVSKLGYTDGYMLRAINVLAP